MVAENLKRSDEGPRVWMELAGSHVQLSEEVLLKEGEREAEAQSLEDGGVNEGEGQSIVGPIVHAYWHASKGDAHVQV